MEWLKILMIGTGGFAGAVLRYLSIFISNRIFPAPFFPYGTLAVNVTGCLLIGFFTGVFETRQIFGQELQSLVIVGFLGGFTTYSTFGYEVVLSFRQGQMAAAFSYTLLHLVLGIGAVMAGLMLSRCLRPI